MTPMTLAEFEKLLHKDYWTTEDEQRIALALRQHEEMEAKVADLQQQLDKALKGWAQEHPVPAATRLRSTIRPDGHPRQPTPETPI